MWNGAKAFCKGSSSECFGRSYRDARLPRSGRSTKGTGCPRRRLDRLPGGPHPLRDQSRIRCSRSPAQSRRVSSRFGVASRRLCWLSRRTGLSAARVPPRRSRSCPPVPGGRSSSLSGPLPAGSCRMPSRPVVRARKPGCGRLPPARPQHGLAGSRPRSYCSLTVRWCGPRSFRSTCRRRAPSADPRTCLRDSG